MPLFNPTKATAKILYVSQDIGNDNFPGTQIQPFLTIQAAINAANLIAAHYFQIIIEVTPSTTATGYVENLSFTQQGIVLKAKNDLYKSDACIIDGTITVNLTGVAGDGNFTATDNTININGFFLTSSSGDTIAFSGTVFQRLYLNNCFVINGSGGNSAINLTNTGTNSGTKSTVTSRDCDFENNHNTLGAIQVAAGRLFLTGSNPNIQNDTGSGPAIAITGASATGCTVTIGNASIPNQISVTDNLSKLTVTNSAISSGSAACIVTPSSASTGTITIGGCTFTTSATNTITGSGVVVPLGLNLKVSTGGDIIGTVTQAVLAKFPEGQHLIGAGSTAVTNSLLVIKNGHLTSQITTAPTAVANANAGTGRASSVSHATDIAGTLSLTTGTSTWAAGVQTVVTFNKAYVTAPIVVLTPSNATAATIGANTVGVFVTSATGTFSVSFNTADTAQHTFTWSYMVIETQ